MYDGEPIGSGGAVSDVVDADGNTLVNEGVATIPKQTDNNYTNAEKLKLQGIEAGAQVNDIVSDAEMISICALFNDFITDRTNIIGVDSNTALAF